MDSTGCSTTGSSERACSAGMRLLSPGASGGAREGPRPPNLSDGHERAVCLVEVLPLTGRGEPRMVPDGGRSATLTGPSGGPGATEQLSSWWADPGLHHGRATSREPRSATSWTAGLRGGPDLPIHVDGASAGSSAPFISRPWSGTSVPRVASITPSGHKYGLCNPWVRLGCVSAMPRPAPGSVFNVNYHLLGHMPTFALNSPGPARSRRAVLQLLRARLSRVPAGAPAASTWPCTCPGSSPLWAAFERSPRGATFRVAFKLSERRGRLHGST